MLGTGFILEAAGSHGRCERKRGTLLELCFRGNSHATTGAGQLDGRGDGPRTVAGCCEGRITGRGQLTTARVDTRGGSC